MFKKIKHLLILCKSRLIRKRKTNVEIFMSVRDTAYNGIIK